MASGSEPNFIQRFFLSLEKYCNGLSLCGAGGGGYGILILKKEYSILDIRNIVKQYNDEINTNNNEKSFSIQNIEIDMDGTTANSVTNSEESSIASFII